MKSLTTFFLTLTLFMILVSTSAAENTPPSLSRGNVSPKEDGSTTYTFMVTYTDKNNDTPLKVQVVVNQKSFDMKASKPHDNNFTDGKEYYVTIKLSEGQAIYYFICEDSKGYTAETQSITLGVSKNTSHSDILDYLTDYFLPAIFIVIMIFFFIPLVLIIFQLRKITKELSSLKKIGKESEKDNF